MFAGRGSARSPQVAPETPAGRPSTPGDRHSQFSRLSQRFSVQGRAITSILSGNALSGFEPASRASGQSRTSSKRSSEYSTALPQRPRLLRGQVPWEGKCGDCCFGLFRLKGSVFPRALRVAVPCGALGSLAKVLSNMELIQLSGSHAPLTEHAAWAGFSFLVGFLVVFRTSQAYSRFCDGVCCIHQMRAEWYGACSAIVAFCRASRANRRQVDVFQQVIVRLFSILHAVALAQVEDFDGSNLEDVDAFTFELLDAGSLDEQSLRALKRARFKVELVHQWIQCHVVDNIGTGVLNIPPPLLSRTFQEIAIGMGAFHQALKVSRIPFPFPYVQACNGALALHWLLSPLVVTQWVHAPHWVFVFTFIQVFMLWTLNFIALDIENPFGQDQTDLDGRTMQKEMNEHLQLLISADSNLPPMLAPHVVQAMAAAEFPKERSQSVTSINSRFSRHSLMEVWQRIDNRQDEDGEPESPRQTICGSPRGTVYGASGSGAIHEPAADHSSGGRTPIQAGASGSVSNSSSRAPIASEALASSGSRMRLSRLKTEPSPPLVPLDPLCENGGDVPRRPASMKAIEFDRGPVPSGGSSRAPELDEDADEDAEEILPHELVEVLPTSHVPPDIPGGGAPVLR